MKILLVDDNMRGGHMLNGLKSRLENSRHTADYEHLSISYDRIPQDVSSCAAVLKDRMIKGSYDAAVVDLFWVGVGFNGADIARDAISQGLAVDDRMFVFVTVNLPTADARKQVKDALFDHTRQVFRKEASSFDAIVAYYASI